MTEHGQRVADQFLILDANGLVVNATVGLPPSLPDGWEAICREGKEEPWIGWTRVDGIFVNPEPEEIDE